MQLGLFPRVNVIHTNAHVEGQIYVPEVNWAYLTACILLVAGFRSSHNLAPAYGLAVTGTMTLTTLLFYLVATRVWHWRAYVIGPVCAVLVCVDIAFFFSNATQFWQGGYITLLIAAASAFVMLTWRKGRSALAKALQGSAMPMEMLLASLRMEKPHRVKGAAVFMTSNAGAPLSLVHYFKHAKTLHERVVFLTVQTTHVPEIDEAERVAEVIDYGEGLFGAKVRYGFMESPDIPAVVGRLREYGLDIDIRDLSFFLGRESLVYTGNSRMTLTRKVFFKFLSQNAVPASAFFRLPPGRVIELGIQIEI
jgi:KUP system potassium uptake protein